eukprot:70190_1
MAHFVLLSLFNTVYMLLMVTSTLLLYNIFDTYASDPQKLDTKDFILISVYFFPTAVFYIGSSIGLAYVIYKTSPGDYHHIHADVICLWCLNLTILGRPPDSGAKDHCINECCDKISRNIPMLIINIISIFIITFIIFIFFPILPVGLLYNNEESAMYLGVFIQYIITSLNVLFHLFCLTQYGYYSLIIILLGLLYIFSGFVYYGSDSFDISNITWIIFEMLSILLMLTITFTVQYTYNILYWINIIFFINYLFPNIPFSKLMLKEYYMSKFKGNSYFTFLTSEIYGKYNSKCYYILHALSHPNKSYSVRIDLRMSESTQLLPHTHLDGDLSINEYPTSNHVMNSIQCFKMQYEFATVSKRCKKKMISELHPGINSQCFGNVFTYLYAISSLVAFFYPFLWFGFCWIYLHIWRKEYDINAQYGWIWIICIAYCGGCIYWIMWTVCINWPFVFCEKIRQIWNCKNAIIFLSSIKGLYDDSGGIAHVKDAKGLLARQEIIETVINAQCFQTDVSFVILSYLY